MEECPTLNVNELNRRGDLPKPPKDEIWVLVQLRDRDGGNWQKQYIRVERTPCSPFGGVRPYFRCWSCDRRTEWLYQRYRGFYRCRRCLNLSYESQREDACGRAFRAVGKIKARLGGDPDIEAPFPPRPKDMWASTYQRLWYRYLEADERADDAFEQKAARLLRGLR